MRVKIQSCTKDLRQTQDGRPYTGVKINGEWFNISGDHRNLYNKSVDVEIKGKWVKLINGSGAVAGSSAPASAPDSIISWWKYIDAMRQAHTIAAELEPEDGQARAALVNTAMIALTNGKIQLLTTEEEPAPAQDGGGDWGPPDDDMPF